MTSPAPRIIVALDYRDIESVRSLVHQLNPQQCRLKVGPILFTRYGPALIQELIQLGFSIFLDLKFHDIPNTVANACYQAAELGVWMISLHISGGWEMLSQARKILEPFGKHRPLLVGISVLTSLNETDLQQIGYANSLPETVTNLALLAQKAQLDGVVCSPHEVGPLRKLLNSTLILVTPGIRWEEGNSHDQKRMMSPRAAIEAGSDYLVIGRAITEAKDPMTVLQQAIHTIS